MLNYGELSSQTLPQFADFLAQSLPLSARTFRVEAFDHPASGGVVSSCRGGGGGPAPGAAGTDLSVADGSGAGHHATDSETDSATDEEVVETDEEAVEATDAEAAAVGCFLDRRSLLAVRALSFTQLAARQPELGAFFRPPVLSSAGASVRAGAGPELEGRRAPRGLSPWTSL